MENNPFKDFIYISDKTEIDNYNVKNEKLQRMERRKF